MVEHKNRKALIFLGFSSPPHPSGCRCYQTYSYRPWIINTENIFTNLTKGYR